MLNFIDDKDFAVVDKYVKNDDGSISWTYNDGESFHSGIIDIGNLGAWDKLQSLINSGKVEISN